MDNVRSTETPAQGQHDPRVFFGFLDMLARGRWPGNAILLTPGRTGTGSAQELVPLVPRPARTGHEKIR